MSNRMKIVDSMVELFNNNLNGTTYTSNIYGSAEGVLKFWDEVNSYPFISVTAGDEFREYLPAGFKWGFLSIKILIYVESQDSVAELEGFLEDIETLLDANNSLEYDSDAKKTIEQISILSISTDEGLQLPLSVGEMQIQIRYDV